MADQVDLTDSIEAFNTRYYILNKRMMLLLGIWPLQKKLQKHTLLVFVITPMLLSAILVIIKGYEEWYSPNRKFEMVTESFNNSVYLIGCTITFIMHVLYEDKLLQVYKRISEDWKNIKSEKEEEILLKSWNTGRLIMVFSAAYAIAMPIIFSTTPAVVPMLLNVIQPLNESRPKGLGFNAKFFVDEQKYFFVIYCWILLTAIISVTILATTEGTYITTVYHALGIMDVIRYRMTDLFGSVDDKTPTEIKMMEKQIYFHIRHSLKLHIDNYEYIELIKISHSESLFVNCTLSLLNLTIGGLTIASNLDRPLDVLRIAIVWAGYIQFMFYVSWPGQRLTDKNDELYRYIYTCGWTEYPPRTRFLIHFMLMRCSEPCRLKAGPLLDMNFQTVGSILQSALSYYMVFRSVSE